MARTVDTETREAEEAAGVKWVRRAPGLYESADGRFEMWQVPGVYPPGWDVGWTTAHVCAQVDADPEHVSYSTYATSIVDGAATMADARWFAAREIAAIDANDGKPVH